MQSYIITIAPNDDSGTTTTLVVDTSGGRVRITDVHLHADAGLAGGQMPSVDVALLLRAIATSTTVSASIEATPAPAPVDTEPVAASGELAEHRLPAAAEANAVVEAASTPRTRRRIEQPGVAPAKRARSRQAATANATTAPKKRTATPAKAAKTTPAKKTTKPADVGGGGGGKRAYRRMPGDFAAVYRHASTSAAIADHYGVPRHTAQGWIRQFRATAVTPSPAGD
ncbi:hypothetical protein [Dactylosporangium darangshiense]|uniref:Helix-turn-helix domain-containing protein n=1 Tax=Dactylosporangium darangshiense TaxID=579108 RepID=A0ABP8DW38_9ACTN